MFWVAVTDVPHAPLVAPINASASVVIARSVVNDFAEVWIRDSLIPGITGQRQGCCAS